MFQKKMYTFNVIQWFKKLFLIYYQMMETVAIGLNNIMLLLVAATLFGFVVILSRTWFLVICATISAFLTIGSLVIIMQMEIHPKSSPVSCQQHPILYKLLQIVFVFSMIYLVVQSAFLWVN